MALSPIRRKSAEDLEKDLKQIYKDPEGQMPDLKRFDGRKRGRLFGIASWLIFFAVALAAVSWTGYAIFLRAPSFTGDRAVIRIDSPASFAAGSEVEISVFYRNDERIPLASATLSAELPREFVELSSSPARDQGGRWPIGSVAPGAEGRVIIKGWVRKEQGATLTFRGVLTYKPADFNSQFQKVVSHTVPVEGSALVLSATGTSEIIPGDKAEFIFDIENTSERTQEGLEFRLNQTDGFIFASALPAPSKEFDDRWTLASLAPHEKKSITVRGTFSADARGPKTLTGAVGYANDDSFTMASSASVATEVRKSDVSVSLIVNGSDRPPVVSFGDILYVSLNWKNAGDVRLKDVTLSAELPSKPEGIALLDWIALKDDAGGTRKGNVVTWTSKQIPELADLAPGDDGTINFSVPLVKKPPAPPSNATSTAPYAVEASARGKSAKAGKNPGREVVSEPIVIQLNSDAVFKAYGRYYDDSGVPLGSGPIPPNAGESTTYRIFWSVANTLHELSNMTVSTVLPEGVKWSGTDRQVDAGTLSFDSTGRKATWQLNRLPTSVTHLTASFDVVATPSFQDVGGIMPITGDNRFEALDKATQAVILKTEPAIGTDLLGDDTAGGKGIVRE